MQNQQINKIKGLVGIANKAGYVIFGADNLKNYNKKMYLLVKSSDAGKNLNKIAEFIKQNYEIEIIELQNEVMQIITNSDNCKIFAIKNKGLSEQIIKIIRGENIG